jgi:hypothetical protein
LAAQDTNHDGVINNLDANFARLQVWQDLNQDGICQPDEMQTLTQPGITSINAGMANFVYLLQACKVVAANDTEKQIAA